MGKSAESKFESADRMHVRAVKIKKSDPESAVLMEALAKKQRRQAIKQLGRRPKPSRRKTPQVL